MEPEPRLIPVAVPRDPGALVVVLHGGARRREKLAVNPSQLSVLRMIPLARRLARVGGGRLAVFRLLNTHRGWDAARPPVQDVRWALRELARRFSPDLPICLVGHSLGGRAALLAAGEPQVSSAVALAPWVLPSDMPRSIDGKRILIVHGTRDRVANPARAAEMAQRLQTIGAAKVDFRLVEGGKHAMLRHHRAFSEPAAQFAVATTLPKVSLADLENADGARPSQSTVR